MTEQTNQKIHNIQILRFIAAFLVLIGHLFMEGNKHAGPATYDYTSLTRYPWGAGVDLFFIISGFVISHVVSRMEPTWDSVKVFFVRRFVRIVPIYWFYTLLMTIAILCFSDLLRSSVLDWHHLLASLFFIPIEHPLAPTVRPVLGQGWTLNYEVLFYALVGSSLLIQQRFRAFYTIVLLLLICLSAFIFSFTSIELSFMTDPIMMEFALGIVLYSAFKRINKIPNTLCLLLIVAGFIIWHYTELMFPENNLRLFSRGFPAALVAAGTIFYRNTRFSKLFILLEKLGDASYSLYLSHPFVLVPSFAIARSLGLNYSPFMILILILLCIGASILSYKYMELPLIRIAKRLIIKRQMNFNGINALHMDKNNGSQQTERRFY